MAAEPAAPNRGFPEDFETLVLLCQRRIYRVLLLYVRDPDVADTLTQECFLRGYERRSSYRGEASVETWLLRIAVNLARDHAKNRRVRFWTRLVRGGYGPALDRADPRLSPEGLAIAREEVAAVREAVDRLPEQQRSVFLLRFAEDMTLEEIAAVLEVEVGTVKSHLTRALAKVKQHLEAKSR